MNNEKENDYEVIEFSITLKELESAVAFAKRHREPSITIQIESGSIGETVTISCCDGSSKTDITDYKSW